MLSTIRNLATAILAFVGVVTVVRRGGDGPAGGRRRPHPVTPTVNRRGHPDGSGGSAGVGDGTAGRGDGRGVRADHPSQIPAAGWKEIMLRVKDEISEDRISALSQAVAFSALLSLFPLMIAGISLYGFIADPATVAGHIDTIRDLLPSDAASLLTDQLERLASTADAALGITAVVALLGALFGASGGIGMLINGLNIAYDEEDDRGFVKNKLLAIGLTVAAILFMAVAFTLLTVPVTAVADFGVLGVVLSNVARWVLLAVMVTVALSVLYRLGPDRADAEWRWLTPGAAVAAVLWLIGSAGFSLFVDTFGSYDETYGALAGVIVLMLWLRISALIVLIGAEINAETELQTARDTTTGPDQPLGQRGAHPADTPPPDLAAAGS